MSPIFLLKTLRETNMMSAPETLGLVQRYFLPFGFRPKPDRCELLSSQATKIKFLPKLKFIRSDPMEHRNLFGDMVAITILSVNEWHGDRQFVNSSLG